MEVELSLWESLRLECSSVSKGMGWGCVGVVRMGDGGVRMVGRG